jgi:hypothetical protein
MWGTRVGFLLVIFLVSGCALLQNEDKEGRAQSAKQAVEKAEEEKSPVLDATTRSQGFALLTQLMSDEKDVSKLLIIKRERTELHDLITTIAERCKAANQHLQTLKTELNLKDDGLPVPEVAARKIIAKHKAKALITEGGKDFEVQLLLSQNEALTYGAALAGALGASEADNPERAWLNQLQRDLSRLQERVFQMMYSHYSWSKDKP